MTGLNAKVVLAPDTQVLFRSKDTGLPLRNGRVEFYKDTDRSTPNKPIYMLTGSPPAYTYTELPNPLQLTAIGTMSDGFGNDIVPYFYPYQGTIDQNSATVELYYIRVYDSNGVFQYDRQAWPWPDISGGSIDNVSTQTNYITNGQFLLHDNIPASNDGIFAAGQIRQDTTGIAPNTWYFSRSPGSTAKDFVTFYRFPSAVTSPTANPRYAVEISCTQAAGDAFKFLAVTWPDVNKFASDTQMYTFGIYGSTVSGGSVPASLYYIKNFGAGGSGQQEVKITDFTITNSYTLLQASFVFGTNIGSVIGTGDDDFIGLELRLPPNSSFDIRLTDAILTPGQVILTQFPVTPNANFLYQALAGGLPTPHANGSDLYCNIRLTPTGMEFDKSTIGDVSLKSADNIPVGYLFADGSTFPTDGYSADGIPYSRLQSVYVNANPLLSPRYGTGADYFTAYLDKINIFTLHNNSNGITAFAADSVGPTATGFTFTPLNPTPLATYNIVSSWSSDSSFLVSNTINGTSSNDPSYSNPNYPKPVDSGFDVFGERAGNHRSPMWSAVFTDHSVPSGLAGRHFIIESVNNAQNYIEYMVWFKVDGAGTMPVVPGTTAILVNLLSADTTIDVARKISNVINAWTTTNVTCTAGSTLTGGDYWTATSITRASTLVNYAVWYKVDNVGTAPSIGGTTNIEVDILSTDSAAIVAQKTVAQINRFRFGIPDYRGYFLRCDDPTGANDTLFRYSYVDGDAFRSSVGSYQYDDNLYHYHVTNNVLNDVPPFNQLLNNTVFQFSNHDLPSNFVGSSQASVRNASVKAVIKY